jgi:hypothetical protein
LHPWRWSLCAPSVRAFVTSVGFILRLNDLLSYSWEGRMLPLSASFRLIQVPFAMGLAFLEDIASLWCGNCGDLMNLLHKGNEVILIFPRLVVTCHIDGSLRRNCHLMGFAGYVTVCVQLYCVSCHCLTLHVFGLHGHLQVCSI